MGITTSTTHDRIERPRTPPENRVNAVKDGPPDAPSRCAHALRCACLVADAGSAETIEEKHSEMHAPNRQRLRLAGGTELSFITAGGSSPASLALLPRNPP